MSYSVRAANFSDIDWLKSQLKQFSQFADSKLQLYGDDEEYTTLLLKNLIQNHIVFICDKQAEPDELGKIGWIPVGFIGGKLHRHFFNPKIRCLTEYFWWVATEYRESRAGYLLFKEFNTAGEALADWVAVSTMSQSPVNEGFFEKAGYEETQKTFLREVSHA